LKLASRFDHLRGFRDNRRSSRVLLMAMKSTVVIVALTLAFAILLAASLVLAIERRGELSLWRLTDGPVLRVQLSGPALPKMPEPD
jgi:hypothetical protein